MRIKWIHISDIHYHVNNYESKMLRKDLLVRIRNISELEPFSHVFCTGDLSDKNGNINSDLIQYIRDITNAAGIKIENFIIIPGNHDHDRNDVKTILNKIYDYDDNIYMKKFKDKSYIDKNIELLSKEEMQKLLESFINFNKLHESFKGSPYYINYKYPHIIDNKQYRKYNILKINTSWLDRNSKSKELRCGINMLLEVLKNANLKEDCINICLGHHPLNCFEEKESKRIKDTLQRNNVNIYLCGHVHKPSIKYDHQYDLVEVACSTTKSDNYCTGGFSIGTMDTDLDCYKIEMFRWGNGSWFTEIDLINTDENGKFYFNTKKYKHNTNRIVVDFKLFGNRLSLKDISESIRDEKFELIQYPYTNLNINEIDWNKQARQITNFTKQILLLNDKSIFVYAIAPIPMLIQFGYEMQNNSRINILQYDREFHKWEYEITEDFEDNKYKLFKTSSIKKSNNLAIIISISTYIMEGQLNMHINNNFDKIWFDLKPKKVGYPLYHNHYIKLINEIFETLDNIVNRYQEIHIFASIPAGMAIEFGRRLQKGIYPTIILYNYYQGYMRAITLNKVNYKGNILMKTLKRILCKK